jgi:dipeptidyl aminopeptidase/acylaminoacyl peptidase
MTRFSQLASATSRVMLVALVSPLVLKAQTPAPRAQQQATPAWISADRAVLAKETYTVPPAEIRRMVEVPWDLNVAFSDQSPTRKYFLNVREKEFPPLSAYGKPHLYLGGLEVDPQANRARSLTTREVYALEVIDPTTGKRTPIESPKNAITIASPTWSPDGARLAYVANFADASHVYVADPATGKSTQITTSPLLATLVTTLKWTADNRHIATVLIPDARGPAPKKPELAPGPITRLWMDSTRDAERNFWSLLQDPYEEDLMQYYVTGQVALIDVATKAVKKVGAPGMIESIDPSADGQYLRVATMQRPFSYVVQYSSFAGKDELWDATGKVLAQISEHGVRLAKDSADAGGGGRGRGNGKPNDPKRGLAWMPQGAGVYYLEPVPSSVGAADTAGGGEARGRGSVAARPSRVVQWVPPFGPNDTKVLFTSDAPISSVAFSDDAKTLFVAAVRRGAGEIVAVPLSDPSTKHYIVRPLAGYVPSLEFRGRNVSLFGGGVAASFLGTPGTTGDSLAFYGNPGALVTRAGTRGGEVAMVSPDGAVFLEGIQYSPDGLHHPPREFVDKVDINTGAKTRVFEAVSDVSESVVAPLDESFSRVVVNRESPTQISNVYLRDGKTGAATKLTDNRDYTPDFTNAVRKRIVVTRADGIRFVVNLTLPPGYRQGTRLPAMFWFYPREYTDQANYDRTLRAEDVNAFPQKHTNPRPIEYLTMLGYAVVNFNPPIVGAEGRMNDNYVSDLVMNLTAVIDALDKDGYIDRSRLGIGGHSYGAFSTMNALAHTPFFKAGIAGDGMSNRSLTPTAFQSERRDFWAAQKTYEEMSPFFYADKIQGALLLYHSMEDQNVGTDPISSVRMMQALRANGKPSALFMYPYENHQPATLETELDQWARWTAWLDLYVKHAGESAAQPANQVVP